MKCPWCGRGESRVVDSRPAEDGGTIRRRRECESCHRRFTTFERSEALRLTVVKRDGTTEPYARAKVLSGIRQAIVNRPVDEEQVARLADRVDERIRKKGPRVTSQDVGIEVLAGLRKLDQVAYMRFASVYKDFDTVTDFEKELGILLQKRDSKAATRRR